MKSFLLGAALLLFALTAGAGELQKAAGAGDIEKVRALIHANPAGVSVRDAGTTALHEATRAGHIEIVKLLVASGANVNATDFSGLTPLRLALGMRRLEIADFLKQNGGLEKVAPTPRVTAPAAAAAVQPATGLFATNRAVAPRSNGAALAATNAATAATTQLPAPRQPTEREMLPVIFPIHEAARIGDVEQIKFLFQNAPDIVNATDQKGLTPLHVAAAHQQFAVAQTLLGLRAKVNPKAVNGQTPLHVAVRNGDAAITGLLITNRALIDARDTSENTPLLLALQAADAEALDAGGGLAAKTTFVASNNLAAMRLQQFRLTSLLVNARADVNVRNRFGATPLTESVRLGNEGVVSLLLAKGANPNVAETSTARTPLHVAAMRGHRAIVESLLRGRAAVNAVDRRGETPLCYALREGRTNTVATLRAAGGTIGKARALDAMEKSLVDFYQRTEVGLQRASSSEKGKILIALNPTKADCERMFPKHAAAAWKVVEEINRQIKVVFAKPLPDAEQGKEIWRILPESPSPGIQEWRNRGSLATGLPIFSLTVEKVGASTRPGDYCFVNGHWVLVPPLRHIAAQIAAAEVPKR
ncbi:MAG TPA: ankyrin repeat domain-containing protein [Methylomirabilota bacterium]|nr:ankyrin repeat domain-containing protein [Methylomirabilota bacterium]